MQFERFARGRHRDAIFLLAAATLFALFALKLLQWTGGYQPERWASPGIASAEVGFFSPNKAVGVDYYAELAKSFLKGHTYLDRDFNAALLSHPNPYGQEAFRKGLVIQDASFYKGKYYLYYGPAPVLTIYLPLYFVTGAMPSDVLVMCLLGIWYAGIVALLLTRVLGPRDWRLLPAFCLLVANPVMLKSMVTMTTVHGVSRIFA